MRGRASLVLALVVGCGGDDTSETTGHLDAGARDAATPVDASRMSDAGPKIECELRAAGQCGSDCYQIAATPVNVDSMCVGTPQYVGCMSRDRGCTAVITLARDANGALFQFGSGCVPKTWTAATITVDGQPTASGPGNWPKCMVEDAGVKDAS